MIIRIEKGGMLLFLARILSDYADVAKGISYDEYVAVCIDTTGLAYVYGEYPDYEDNAYFIQSNCELMDIYPENCSENEEPDWNLNGKALKVYHIKGDTSGVNYFDLNDWQNGQGGSWEDWYVANSVPYENEGDAINCAALSIEELKNESFQLYPNPAVKMIQIEVPETRSYFIYDQQGRLCKAEKLADLKDRLQVDISNLKSGLYFIDVESSGASFRSSFVKTIEK